MADMRSNAYQFSAHGGYHLQEEHRNEGRDGGKGTASWEGKRGNIGVKGENMSPAGRMESISNDMSKSSGMFVLRLRDEVGLRR